MDDNVLGHLRKIPVPFTIYIRRKSPVELNNQTVVIAFTILIKDNQTETAFATAIPIAAYI